MATGQTGTKWIKTDPQPDSADMDSIKVAVDRQMRQEQHQWAAGTIQLSST